MSESRHRALHVGLEDGALQPAAVGLGPEELRESVPGVALTGVGGAGDPVGHRGRGGGDAIGVQHAGILRNVRETRPMCIGVVHVVLG